jgi:hypothetical protein
MTNRMNTQPSANGHAKAKAKVKTPRKRPARTQEQSEAQASRRWGRRQVKKSAMIVMGIAIPLLSLGLSHTGGTLLRERENLFTVALGVAALTLMACVLVVSLSHLAWSVEDLTRSAKQASWLLAITFDLLLVLGELVHVAARETGANVIVTVMMACVCGLSIFLNIWAFWWHPAVRTSEHPVE